MSKLAFFARGLFRRWLLGGCCFQAAAGFFAASFFAAGFFAAGFFAAGFFAAGFFAVVFFSAILAPFWLQNSS